MNEKKILIISYLFPPLGGGGVIRVTKFVKYLPFFDWKPFVVTNKKGFYKTQDQSLLGEVSAAKIERTNYFEPAFWFNNRLYQSFLAYLLYPFFLVPDRQILWFFAGLRLACRTIREEKIPVIFTSSAPASDHLIGLVLKKITGVKWIADFRDEWANNPLKKYPTPIHRILNQYLEKLVVKNADQVITVSEPITRYLKGFSPDKNKFSTITNGFDEADFEGLLSRKDKIFNVVHVGSLYNLKYQQSFESSFQSLDLKNASLTFVEGLSHREAIKKMFEADVLFLVLDSAERPAVLTGKLFEYLRAGKPILAVAGKNSEAAKMINKYRVGEVVEPNLEDFKKVVKKMYQKAIKNDLKIPPVDLEKFKRKNLTENLTKIFENLVKNQRKIKLCLVGNLQSAQNQNLCQFFSSKGYEIHFITTKPFSMAGVKMYFLGKNSFTPWYFLKSLYKIRKIISKIKPDIVHGQDLVFGGIWAYLSGFKPFVATIWGSDINNYENFIGLEKFLIRKTLENANFVTGTSQAIGEKAQKIGLPRKKWHLIHFGIDLELFKNNLQKKAKLKIIFSPRAIGLVYNTDILIEAFSQIAKINKNVRLALLLNYSDEKYLLEIEKKIIKYDLVDKVFFWPKVSNKEMVRYYNQAELIVSISSSDGCSVSFLEAMALGKKIIVTDLPYIKEWRKGQNLWIVPIRDIQATKKAILTALKYPDGKWQKIAKENFDLVDTKAEINNNFEKLNRLYRGLIT